MRLQFKIHYLSGTKVLKYCFRLQRRKLTEWQGPIPFMDYSQGRGFLQVKMRLICLLHDEEGGFAYDRFVNEVREAGADLFDVYLKEKIEP